MAKEYFTGPCSGCHETVDGHSTGDYEYDKAAGCERGCGCHECGHTGKRRTYFDSKDFEPGGCMDPDLITESYEEIET